MDRYWEPALYRSIDSSDRFGREFISASGKIDGATGTARAEPLRLRGKRLVDLPSPSLYPADSFKTSWHQVVSLSSVGTKGMYEALRNLARYFNKTSRCHCGVAYNRDRRNPERAVETEKILVVDDEEAIREVVSTLLEAQGYKCTVCSNGRMALEAFRKDTFDLVLSDIVMPEMDGLEAAGRTASQDPDVPVIMVTAMHDISIALQAIRAGAYDYILKPFEKDQLHLSVRRASGTSPAGASKTAPTRATSNIWWRNARSNSPLRCRIWSNPTTTPWRRSAARWTRKMPKPKDIASA